jgi:hypothetical protein
MVVTTEELIRYRSAHAPVVSHPELELVARDGDRSAIPSICAILVLMLVELAWFGLLLFLARTLIFA